MVLQVIKVTQGFFFLAVTTFVWEILNSCVKIGVTWFFLSLFPLTLYRYLITEFPVRQLKSNSIHVSTKWTMFLGQYNKSVWEICYNFTKMMQTICISLIFLSYQNVLVTVIVLSSAPYFLCFPSPLTSLWCFLLPCPFRKYWLSPCGLLRMLLHSPRSSAFSISPLYLYLYFFSIFISLLYIVVFPKCFWSSPNGTKFLQICAFYQPTTNWHLFKLIIASLFILKSDI